MHECLIGNRFNIESQSRMTPISMRGVVNVTSALVLFSVIASAAPDVYGFGAQVTGGKGATSNSTYVVKNFEELKTALANKGQPHAPKLIYIGKNYSPRILTGYIIDQQVVYISCSDITNYF